MWCGGLLLKVSFGWANLGPEHGQTRSEKFGPVKKPGVVKMVIHLCQTCFNF
jgi:hypothetical protein